MRHATVVSVNPVDKARCACRPQAHTHSRVVTIAERRVGPRAAIDANNRCDADDEERKLSL